ncbi:MAG: hypothetical protein ACYCPQ_10470 [Elusimicrobiota bacterium]
MKNVMTKQVMAGLLAVAALPVLGFVCNIYAQESALAQLKSEASAIGAGQTVPSAVPPKPNAEGSQIAGEAEITALLNTPDEHKTSVSFNYEGQNITVPILHWETGIITSKDSQGQTVQQTFEYPLIDTSGYLLPVGDGQLCWQVCHRACNGSGACFLECAYHCVRQGGEGDPRPPHS